MESKLICFFWVLFVLCLSGCSDAKDIDNDSGAPKIQLSKLSLTAESAGAIFDLYSNIKIAEDVYVGVPDNITQLSAYTSVVPTDIEMKKYHNEFTTLFEYLFPNHKLDENYLLYMGGSSELVYDDNGNIAQNFNKVSEWYDKLVAGEEGRVNFLYDETWFRNMTEWKSPVCLELGNPIGYGYAVINKGKTVELNNSKVYDDSLNAERYPLLESYDPADWLEYVNTYPKDSTESFKLTDKEMPINQAVDFFENYINSLPYPEDKNMKTVVISVDVYKVTEDIYGYYFLTTKEYKGLTYDYMRSGTKHSKFEDYTTTGGNAFMVESDDVDIVYGYYQLQDIASETSYKEIVSFETVSRIISEKMTDGVVFEVQKIELVYTEKLGKTSDGYIDVENPSSSVSPAWKFMLYNPNDNLIYVCYVDAVNGKNFRYYTTPSNQEQAL